MTRAFLDTNVLLYIMSEDAAIATKAEALLRGDVVISVQVLNEFVDVAGRKYGLGLDEIIATLTPFRLACEVQPLTAEAHDRALSISQRYGYRIYDSTILASALLAGCDTVYSQDMHDGQVIERSLTIVNPFRP